MSDPADKAWSVKQLLEQAAEVSLAVRYQIGLEMADDFAAFVAGAFVAFVLFVLVLIPFRVSGPPDQKASQAMGLFCCVPPIAIVGGCFGIYFSRARRNNK